MRYRAAAAAILVATLLTACTDRDSATTSTVVPAPTTTATSTIPTATDVFEKVGPSIAFVETDIATGSGILIERGLILTAAHVVWPQREVRVAFPGAGSTGSARVIGTDLLADLALIDVSSITDQPEPVILGNGEELDIGSTVYMIGYPAETERNPEPTISEGILSRFREWRSEEWTFIQSDAAVVGGQSGGALVDANGNVIGVTNFHLATEYGLSGSIADVEERIEDMKADTDRSEIGDRLPPTQGGDETHQIRIAHWWDQQAFTFEVPLYTEVDVSTNRSADTAIEILTIDGFSLVYADDNTDRGETATAFTTMQGPHLVLVTSWMNEEVEELVTSSEDLIPWKDPDDGTVVRKPGTVVGNIDFPGDRDWFWIDLGDGQSVTIEVDSATVDPEVYIDSLDNFSEFTLAYDDDSGGGPFGTNPRLVWTAEQTGTYLVIVSDYLLTGPGAYVLTIE